MFGSFRTFGRMGASVSAGSAPWSPARLFATGEEGAWYDPSDLATLFQDSAGTTPVTAVGQPVGLILDKSGNGNHASQSTSTARPLLSARVNLLTATEDFTAGANWGVGSTTLGGSITAGGVTLTRVVETAATANFDRYGRISFAAGSTYTVSAKFKASERTVATIRTWAIDYGSDASQASYFDLVAGTAQKASSPSVTDAGITALSDGVYLCWVTCTPILNTPSGAPSFGMSSGMGTFSYLGDPANGIYIGEASTTLGALTDYQRVTTDSDYDATPGKFLYYLKFDGVDDFLSTAAMPLPQPYSAFFGVNVTATDGALFTAPGAGESLCQIINPFGSAIDMYAGTHLNGGPAIGFNSGSVLTLVYDGADAFNRKNGALNASGPVGSGGLPGALYIGSSGGTSTFLNGNLYSIVIAGALYDAATIDAAEAWVAGKTGVTL